MSAQDDWNKHMTQRLKLSFRRAAWEAGKDYRRIDDAETFMQGDQWPPGWPRERPDL